MQIIAILIAAAVIFGICRLVDVLFQKRFRSKQQHMSGMAVRVNKRFGVFGVALIILGILALINSGLTDMIMLWGGIAVMGLGIAMACYYLGYGVFYDGESFLISAFAKKDRVYRFEDILSQRLYVVTGGNVVIELALKDGTSLSLQSGMDGVYPFMDTAFAAWCMQTGTDPQSCTFYDPSKSWWFPHEEET